MHAVGLVQRNQRGGEYDRFRSRIMFPIRDARGRTLGFGGRAMRDDQGAKYVNTAETDFFHKSQILYGLDRARAAMARANRAVVVEGYTDVIALHQAGIEGTVAVMGTAITPDQVKALSGNVSEVVLALDADEAGQAAMVRVQGVAGERKMRLRVAAMPKGVDPAEMMLEENGSERFRALVESSGELTDFQVGLVLEGTDVSSPVARDEALDKVAPIIAVMGEGVSQSELMRKVADRLDLEPAMVMGRVVASTPATGGPAASSAPPARTQPERAEPRPPKQELTSRERRERALLAMCIALPEQGAIYLEKLGEPHLSASGRAAVDFLRIHLEDPAKHLPQENGALAALITELVMMAREEPASEETMEWIFMQLDQRRLEDELAAAAERGDYERRASLSRERAALVERIARAPRVGS
jgi:DNA primase